MQYASLRRSMRGLPTNPLHEPFCRSILHFLTSRAWKRLGRPALGVLHNVTERGPLRSHIDGKQDTFKNDRFVLVPQADGSYIVKATGKPDLEYFSPFELNEMKRLVETHADQFVKVPTTKKRTVRQRRFEKKHGPG